MRRISSLSPGRPTEPVDLAEAVDTLELYRWAVQDPETHAEVLRIMYERLRPGRTPAVLREDFAGTAAESVAWVALRRGRRAVAVDFDGPTVAWARRRAEKILEDRAGAIDFIEADVMDVTPPRAPEADILSVLNFSILYLLDEEALREYFTHALRCLSPQGVLVVNAFGGREARRARVDQHRVTPSPRLATESAAAPFEYIWEQRAYDPRTRQMDCRIHFGIPDRNGAGPAREVRDAFRYHWRLWTLEELAESLQSAGFDEVQAWRHTYDPAKGPAGVFLGQVPIAEIEGLPHWTAYLVACRDKAELPRPRVV